MTDLEKTDSVLRVLQAVCLIGIAWGTLSLLWSLFGG